MACQIADGCVEHLVVKCRIVIRPRTQPNRLLDLGESFTGTLISVDDLAGAHVEQPDRYLRVSRLLLRTGENPYVALSLPAKGCDRTDDEVIGHVVKLLQLAEAQFRVDLLKIGTFKQDEFAGVEEFFRKDIDRLLPDRILVFVDQETAPVRRLVCEAGDGYLALQAVRECGRFDSRTGNRSGLRGRKRGGSESYRDNDKNAFESAHGHGGSQQIHALAWIRSASQGRIPLFSW